MKKLEDIEPKEIFSVPEGYFEKLPSVIQARLTEKNIIRKTVWYQRPALRYAVPVLALFAVVMYRFIPPAKPDVISLLESVEVQYLEAYLAESGITTEELLEVLDPDSETADDMEMEIYFGESSGIFSDLTSDEFNQNDL